jgi:hypothetical protein
MYTLENTMEIHFSSKSHFQVVRPIKKHLLSIMHIHKEENKPVSI